MASKKIKKAPAKPNKASAAKKAAPKVLAKVAQKISAVLNKKKPAPAKKVAVTKAKPAAPAKKIIAAPAKPLKGKPVSAPAKVPAKAMKAKPAPAPAPAPITAKGKKGAKVIAVEVSVPVVKVKGGKSIGGGKAGKKADSAHSLKKKCREPGCDNDPIINTYCRLHYIKNWKKIKRKEAIIAAGQLNSYVEELVNKYPDKYLDVIRQDLSSEKDWSKVVTDLELDSVDDEFATEEEAESAAEGTRRGGDRDFDDEGDAF